MKDHTDAEIYYLIGFLWEDIDLEGGILANYKREQTCQTGEPKRGEGEGVNLCLSLVHCVLIHCKALEVLFDI